MATLREQVATGYLTLTKFRDLMDLVETNRPTDAREIITRVVIIKLAYQLHNMRTLEHLPPERRQLIAQETLDIYAPIAHRLGMGLVRGELEDLAFKYTDDIGYQQVHEAVEARRQKGEE